MVTTPVLLLDTNQVRRMLYYDWPSSESYNFNSAMAPLQHFCLKVILLPFITECAFHLGAYQTQKKYKFGKTCICHIDYRNTIYNALAMFLNSCMFLYLKFIFLYLFISDWNIYCVFFPFLWPKFINFHKIVNNSYTQSSTSLCPPQRPKYLT